MNMENILLQGLYALLSSLSSSFTAIFLKIGVSDKGNAIMVNLVKIFIGMIGLFITTTVYGVNISIDFNEILLLIMAALLGPVLAWFSYIKSLERGRISIVHPIVNTYPLYAMIFSYIILGSQISVNVLFSFLLILFSIYLISSDENEERIDKKIIIYPCITSICWGMTSVLFKILLLNNVVLKIAFLRSFFSFIAMALIILIFSRESFKKIDGKSFLTACMAGFFSDIVGIFFWFSSLDLGSVAVTTTISSSSPVFSSLMSSIIFKYRIPIKRWIGIFLTIIGITIIYFS